MTTPALIEYIRAQRTLFAPDDTIRNTLRASGWVDAAIDAGFAEANGIPALPQSPTVAAVVADTQSSGNGLLRIALITIALCVTIVFVYAVISVLIVFYNGGKAVQQFELLQTQIAVELAAGSNHDLYPPTLAGIAKNPDTFDYTVAPDQKSYRLCLKGQTDAAYCKTAAAALPQEATTTEFVTTNQISTSTPQEYYDEINGMSFTVPAGWAGRTYREDDSGKVALKPIEGDSHVNIQIVSTYSYENTKSFSERYRTARLALRTTETKAEAALSLGGEPATGVRYLYDFPSWGKTRTSEYVVSNVGMGYAYIFDINGEADAVERYEKDYLSLLASIKFFPRKQNDFSEKTRKTYETFGGGIYNSTYSNSNFQIAFPFGWMPIAAWGARDDGLNAQNTTVKEITVTAQPDVSDNKAPPLWSSVNVYRLKSDVTLAMLLEENIVTYRKSFRGSLKGDITVTKTTIGGEDGYILEMIGGNTPKDEQHMLVNLTIHNGRSYSITAGGPELSWNDQSVLRAAILRSFAFTD